MKVVRMGGHPHKRDLNAELLPVRVTGHNVTPSEHRATSRLDRHLPHPCVWVRTRRFELVTLAFIETTS
jgi:hypothetical protein